MSKNLDEELARALSATDRDESTAGTDAPPVARALNAPSGRRSNERTVGRNVGLLVTLLALVGAVVTLFLVGFKEAAVYSLPVDKLLADPALAGRKVRIEGELVVGSLVKRDDPCEYRFVVETKGTDARIPVRHPQCVIPDTFRDVPSGGVQVTVEGTLREDGHFDSTLVLAKCTSKYDPNSHEMKGDLQAEPGEMPIN